MLLKKVIIENFRSIEKLEIEITDIAGYKLNTFFGINESGKSNILKSINLLNPNSTISYEFDCNKNAIKQGLPICITYIFELNKSEKSELADKMAYSNANYYNYPNSQDSFNIAKIVLYDEESKRKDLFLMNPNGLNRNPEDEEMTTPLTFITRSSLDLNIDYLMYNHDCDFHYDNEICLFFDEIIPEVLFWKHSDEYLITKQINMEQFKNNPNTSIPLKHIFNLAGYYDERLVKNITKIQNSSEIRAEFEDELSECITKHINKIWPEHLIDIQIRLENNSFCDIFVKDQGVPKQRFNMNQRSDGFKQFISILLTLSVENETNQLKNKIILLDEPERSLHPGSIRCLREELLEISTNNIILASSHSVFMVDKKHLDRHCTVTKEDGKTIVQRVKPENPIQDEVIYNALGTSIFELIEPNILIFEGRTDKDIFDAFTRKYEDELQPSSILTISATGTKQIPNYVKFFHNKIFNGFVVVDSDSDGRNAINAIMQQDSEFKKSLFELKNLVNIEKRDATLEDLLPEELVLSCASKLYETDFESQDGVPILSHIKSIIKMKKIESNRNIEQLKNMVVHQVLEDIEKEDKDNLKKKYTLYFDFLIKLHSKIKGTN